MSVPPAVPETDCGNGVVEGTEPCDDANLEIGDGCTPDCELEPSCMGGTCTPTCGDGQLYPTEVCDDGNLRDGDGCSSTCEEELGWTCTTVVTAPPPTVTLPVVLRDFRGWDIGGHPDFQHHIRTEIGITEDVLDAEGKPVFDPTFAHLTVDSATSFAQWYRSVPGVNRTVADRLTFTRQPDGTYVFDDTTFFPLDGRGFNFFEDLDMDGFSDDPQFENLRFGHNFLFTSEVRFWFEYRGGERLDFRGDDDVWVFINNRLAVDIGGVHGPIGDFVDLDTDAAALGLTIGGIYEAVVFQAERHTTGSNYRLTLSNFFTGRTECVSTCGDGIVTAAEICDDGDNDGSPGGCNPDCLSRGPLRPPGIYQELRFNGSPAVETCEETVELRSADVYFLIDTTGSMSMEIGAIQAALTSGNLEPGRPECAGGITGALRCNIPDVRFGVGISGDYPVAPYGVATAPADSVYQHLADLDPLIGPTRSAIAALVAAGGGDGADGQSQALFQVATGGGLGALGDSLTAAGFAACPADTFGFPCFRNDAQPVIFHITDSEFHNGSSPTADYDPMILGFTPPAFGDVTAQLATAGIKFIGLDSSGGSATVRNDLVAFANATDSIDELGNALVFDIGTGGTGLGMQVVEAIEGLAGGALVDITAVPRDTTPMNGVDETSFITNIRAASFTGGTCLGTAGDRFLDCTQGTQVQFEVTLQNLIVPELDDAIQTFDFVLDLVYDDTIVATEKPVRVVVPRAIPACAEIDIETERVTPNVTIVIDESGSMNSGFTGAATRWEAVRDTLFGAAGDCDAFRTSGGNYDLCGVSETQCTGRVNDGDSRDCDDFCTQGGMVCVQAYDLLSNNTGDRCDPNLGSTRACDDTSDDSFCVCEYADGRATGADTSTGVIDTLDDQVRFGLLTYTSRQYEDSSSCAGPSEGVSVVALDNLNATKSFFETNHPSGGTPTAEALREVYDDIVATPPPDGPSIVILATDGSPNGCSTNSRADVVAQVDRGFGNGITTYVVSVGSGVAVDHLQDVANAGVGVTAADPDAPFFVAGTATELSMTLESLIRSSITCELDTTTGTIAADVACSGIVTLNGRPLACEDPNGWRRVDEDTIEIQGTACDELLADGTSVVTGRFPCAPATGTYRAVYEAFETVGRCEPGSDRVLWDELTYDITTPPDTRIEFIIAGADTVTDLGTAPTVTVVAPPVISPVNLDALFTADPDFPRSPAALEVIAFLYGSRDRLSSPVLREMSVSYNCDDGS
ncbi:MAG: fibro-slime domain-containing protein [Myxococcota bacterium]